MERRKRRTLTNANKNDKHGKTESKEPNIAKIDSVFKLSQLTLIKICRNGQIKQTISDQNTIKNCSWKLPILVSHFKLLLSKRHPLPKTISKQTQIINTPHSTADR